MHPIWLEPLSIDRLTIAITNLHPSLRGTKLVQLSDFHYDGQRLGDDLLMEAIAASNAENPDLILLTGDFITDEPEPIDCLCEKLRHLQSRTGICACLGNHDNYYFNARPMVTKALTRVGVQVLWNAIAHPLGEHLPIVGFADLWSKQFHPQPILSQLSPETPRIVLSHNPDTADLLRSERVDLQLSGHTHGGQIVLPGLGSFPSLLQPLRKMLPQPLYPFVPLLRECARVVEHWEWGQGYHRLGANQLYVNRGLGTYFPGRLNCPPELTVITLIPA